MKLLIILMSVFLLALTPAKQAKKLADKHSSVNMQAIYKTIEDSILRAAKDGKYTINQCVESEHISSVKGKLLGLGYRTYVSSENNCDAGYKLNISWE